MIELNGLANLKILLDEMTENLPNDDRVTVPAAKMYQQLELLNRYMVAIGTRLQASEKAMALNDINFEIPYWHEVKANPKLFPTNHEVHGGSKQEKLEKV